MNRFRFKQMTTVVVVCGFLAMSLASCFSQKIVIGNGAPARPAAELAANEESVWTWHLIYGLIPLQGPVDAAKMAKGASNYTVVYEESFVNSLLAGITLGIAMPRTVTVKR
jgi:Bor protein